MSSESFQIKRTLEAENKAERKKGYKRLLGVIQDKELSLEDVWDTYKDFFFRGMEDESEGVREISLEALLTLHSFGNEEDWAGFFLILRQKHEESSEEVRLLRVSLLLQVLNRIPMQKVFAPDILSILPPILSDHYHEIRIKGTRLLILISPVIQSPQLTSQLLQILPALCSNFSHIQKNVRESALLALPVVILSAQNCEDEFSECDVALAQRCFDPSPRVRLALSKACSALLKDWRCNTRYHLRILLILLSQYDDGVDEVRQTTIALWKEVADTWMKKEIKCSSDGEALKDKMDFPRNIVHYPLDVSRPSTSCREYLARHFHKILPATWMDLRDWRVETRVKTSQLLYICFLHMENLLTEHSVKILETLEHGIKDNEPEVVQNLERASKYFGYFVDPKIWSPIIIERLTSLDADSKITLLGMLSCIIRGSDASLLSFVLMDLGDVLSCNDVCHTYKSEHLIFLLDCIEGIMTVMGKGISNIRHQVFKIILSSIALSQSYEMKDRGRTLFMKLVQVIELSGGVEELFIMESGKLLEAYHDRCSEWNELSFESSIFGTLLHESGPAMEHHVDSVFQIFHTVLDPSREHLYKLRLQFFMYLSKQISSAIILNTIGMLKKYSLKLIKEIICPALKWSSGKKAEAVRTASACALFSVFESKSLSPKEVNPLISTDLFPRMNSLLEDNSQKTRLLIIKAYKLIFDIGKGEFQPHHVVKILSFLIQRLNDKCNDIRLESIGAIQAAYICLDPEVTDSTYKKELENYYEKIVVHMDDESPDIRRSVCELLQELSNREPQLMFSVLKNALPRHTHKEEISKIIEHIEKLSI